MHIKFDEEMQKKILVYSSSLIIAIVIGIFVYNFKSITKNIGVIANIALPFLIGILLAIILRIPTAFLEKKAFSKFKKKRLISALCVFAFFILLIVLMFRLIIPTIFASLQEFLLDNEEYISNFNFYLSKIEKTFDISLDPIRKLVDGGIIASIPKHVLTIANYSIAFVRFFINMIIALVSAFYIILDKENLKLSFKRLNYSLFNRKIATRFSHYIDLGREIFDKFIVGSIIDSTIIGILCFVGVSLLRLPYSPMIAFIIGVTNIIPVFGPFLGAIPVAFLLVLIKPIYAFVFVIFIFILQQVDGNIIKPKVLGDQLGLSGFWILFSVTIGGGLAGVPGMFLGVPLFALVYRILGEYTEARLKDKHINIDEEFSDKEVYSC